MNTSQELKSTINTKASIETSPDRSSLEIAEGEQMLHFKISELQAKIVDLSRQQMETMRVLDQERLERSLAEQRLAEVEQQKLEQTQAQMRLLNEKAQEQEMYIQSIKVNMQEMTLSYQDKQAELKSTNSKLYKANKSRKEL